ncbi:GTP-binding protein [Streptomyces sp. Termitarium-T10T-6]|nr:GTP-binding protein [Streptomyces sp. Termitarium-T10T-6]
MNDQIHSDGSGHEHGELGDAEYAEFMELAAQEGFDPEEVEGALGEAGHGPLPVLAVVGRPNVGKSTLVNRIIGRREAVVQDKPGVTRDRVSYEAEWAGRRFKVVDTGGWEQDVLGLDASVAAQAEYAIETADAVVFVVDSTVGATDTDEAVVKLLRRAGKPVVLCANKVDGQSGEADATALWSLGLGEPYPVSSLHGRGTGDMLDAVLEALPDAPAQKFGTALGGPRRIALIGRPNVGKSSLLNKVAGEDRVVVNELAGTTRDPVDELINLGGITWKFIDTAGIRRRVHLQEGADYYASLRTAAAVEKAEVAVVLIDSSESISVQDQRIITMAVEAGRAVVVAFNKWDTLDEERRYYLEREIETELAQISWAPRVNVSAVTGRHMEKLVPAIETALEGWGDPRPHRPAQRLPRRDRRLQPAPDPRWQAAAHPLRHPGGHQAPALRALRLRLPGARLPPLRRAPAARGVRLRGHPGSTSPSGSARSAAATSSTAVRRSPGPLSRERPRASSYTRFQESRDPGGSAAGRGRPACRPTRCQEPRLPVVR